MQTGRLLDVRASPLQGPCPDWEGAILSGPQSTGVLAGDVGPSPAGLAEGRSRAALRRTQHCLQGFVSGLPAPHVSGVEPPETVPALPTSHPSHICAPVGFVWPRGAHQWSVF